MRLGYLLNGRCTGLCNLSPDGRNHHVKTLVRLLNVFDPFLEFTAKMNPLAFVIGGSWCVSNAVIFLNHPRPIQLLERCKSAPKSGGYTFMLMS